MSDDDVFDDPELKAYMAHAKKEMFPKMKGSAVSLIVGGEPDPKLCLELGAAILFDKPLIVVVPRGRTISAALKRCASLVIEGHPAEPGFKERITAALNDVLTNDRRSR